MIRRGNSQSKQIIMKDRTKARVIIDIDKYPKIYEHLKESAEMNFRTIEQQALYYIWSALNLEKNLERRIKS